MTPAELQALLNANGVRCQLEKGDRLLLMPRRLVTPEIDLAMRAGKAEFLAWRRAAWDQHDEAEAIAKRIDRVLAGYEFDQRTPDTHRNAGMNLMGDVRAELALAWEGRDLAKIKRLEPYAVELIEAIDRSCKARIEWEEKYGERTDCSRLAAKAAR